MKKIILVLLLPFMCSLSFAQNKEEAEKLVEEGIAFHDKGDYDKAVAIYDKALALDKDNLLALAEKAFSLLNDEKYDESATCCRKAIDKHPGEASLQFVYVTYGNALDGMKKSDKALEVYNEGIRQFPDFYQLHFNKGITLAGKSEYDDAILCFQKAVMLNPAHGSSHNAIARLNNSVGKKRIPSLLAYCRYLSIESESARAKENLAGMKGIMKGNVEKTGKNDITISIDQDFLSDTTADGKVRENNFSTIDMTLSLSAALDYDKEYKKENEVERFMRKFETVCATLKETQMKNHGFYWEYYAPYFIEMKDKGMIETYAYIAFASSDDSDVSKWLKSHKKEIGEFFEWSKSFQWKSN